MRVAVKPEVIEAGLAGSFVALRKQGIAPQDVPADVVEPLVDAVLARPGEEFLEVAAAGPVPVSKPRPTFGLVRCARCGEAVFLGGARLGGERELLCIPCAGYARG